jgi:ATP-dependent Lon protease
MLRGINALSDHSEVMRIPAILLLGPPGVGKTMFAQALANAMQVPFKVVRMENQQAGAGLVGTADFWSNSKPGAVFNILTGGDCGNPVLVVDEVDKAANDSRYDPLNGLYSLLEPNSACTFTDESLPDVSINASKITWLLTANYKNLIPEPILSRVLVFEIPSPDQNQSVKVAGRIYQLLLGESNMLKTRFASTLSDEVAQLIATMTPRKMRLAIEIALGRAAVANRNKIIANDIDVVDTPLKMKIGFM